ncbi:MAG: chlorohydrolase [Planctomycetota bacterium]|nr:MAG: chlorohydrolase [Planctomycetota bacterium]
MWSVLRGRTLSFGEDPGERVGPLVDAPVLLLPGLVNAHAHLDLSASPLLASNGNFCDWLAAVGQQRQGAVDPAEAARVQARRMAGRGVTLVADIDGSRGAGLRGRRAAQLAGRSDQELLGVVAEVSRRRLHDALQRLDREGAGPQEAGLSPHAPYSVARDVLPEIARAARHHGRGLAMHLAESVEETRLLTHGDGPFVAFLEALGMQLPFDATPGLRPIAYAHAAGLLGPDSLVVHGNDLDTDDLQLLHAQRAPVVCCHGTHQHFERPTHPFLKLREAGVTVALGTDSAASNSAPDLFTEMCRLVADRPDIAPAEVLRAGTLGGRRALQVEEGPACFEPGSRADGVLLPLPDELQDAPVDDLLSFAFSGAVQPCASVHAGRTLLPVDGSESGPPGFLDTLLAKA